MTVSLWPVVSMVCMALALPILMGWGARRGAQATIAELERTTTLLQLENASYRGATGQLADQITSLQTAVDEIGAQATADPAAIRAMDKLPALVRSRAMGGGSGSQVAPLFGSAFGSPDNPFSVLRDLLGAIESRLDSVRSGVERRQALAAATPSIWPVAGWLSSSYGNRRDPFTGATDFHPGLDISADAGQRVLVTADGVVESASYNGNYGNLVVVDHGFGITTRYGHLGRYTVTAGQHVRRGHVIGNVGSTGRSTSPHLHYEILMNGALTNPLKLLAR